MTGYWDAFIGSLRGLFWYILDWLVGYGTNAIQGTLDLFASVLPGPVAGAVTAVAPYLELANAWVPLDFMLVGLVSYYTFAVTVYVSRHIIKLIPTVG